MASEAALADRLRDMAGEARRIGSPFYARLCDRLAGDAATGGPTLELLGPTMDRPAEDYHVFRLLDGVHWLVLEGKAPELARHYPSVGGDGDPDAAWPYLRDLLIEAPPEIESIMSHPIQTNEPARAAAFIVGLLELAHRFGHPVDLLELGSSAGLNLHLDRFRYETGGRGWGPVDSPVRLVDHWIGGAPRFDAPLRVGERQGCDRLPVDLRDPSERTRLLAYVWPDEVSRFALNREAVEVASRDPVVVEEAELDDWIVPRLARGPRPGRTTVVLHSLVWLYLDVAVRQRVTSALESAGAAATPVSPLAWLRYEQEEGDESRCDLRLRTWPGGEDRLLATGSHHDTPLTLVPGDR